MISAPARRYDYVTVPAEIYRRSFATIRSEADLSRLPEDYAYRRRPDDSRLRRCRPRQRSCVPPATGIHRPSSARRTGSDLHGHPDAGRRHHPAAASCRQRRDVFAGDSRAAELAARWGTTRSAAAVSLWTERLAGAVVAIGNAPTALFHLLELIADGGPRPAAIIGIPVGFVGSAESKIALAENPWDIPWLVVHGRRGGSALCAAAINALAHESEIA